MFSYQSLSFGLLTGLVLCLQPCSAQTAANVSLSFVSFPKSAEPVKVKLALGEGKMIEIEAPSNWLSKPIQVPAMGTWVVGEMTEGPEDKPSFKELGRAKSPPSPTQIILLVRKGKEDANGFDVLPLDARDTGFSGGKFLFMNAARVDIGGVIGDQKFAVKPGQHAIIKPVGAPGERTFSTALYFRQGDETRPFFSTVWPVSNAARSLIFFYHDPNTQQLRLHTIRNFP